MYCIGFYISLISILFIGCTTRSENNYEIPYREDFLEMAVDPSESISLKTNDFVESVEYINLEKTLESDFSEVSQIEFVDNRFIILDRNINEILFFDNSGKFLRKINPKEKALSASDLNIPSFAVDRKNGKIYFNDLNSINEYEYTITGDFLNVYQRNEIDLSIRESSYSNGVKIDYLSFESRRPDENSPNNIVVSSGDKDLYSYLPFNPTLIDRTDILGARKYFFISNNRLFHTEPYDYNVYSFDESGEINIAYRFNFPNKIQLPNGFTSTDQFKSKRKDFIKRNGHKVYMVTDFYNLSFQNLFKLVGSGFSEKLLYDCNNGKIVSLTKYISDVSTSFLPILGNNILGVQDGKVISALPPSRIVEIINKTSSGGKGVKDLPNEIKEIYRNGNNNNPVLVLTSFKKEISYEAKL